MMKVVSVRLPEGWIAWINKKSPKLKLTQSQFIQDAILKAMWDAGYDAGRKETLHERLS